MLTDAHLHLYDLFEASGGAEPGSIAGLCCASAWNMEEFLWQESFAQRRLTGSVLLSFGIHPQNPDSEALRFLDELASGKRIDAVGECGYDLYTAEYRAQAAEQKTVRDAQFEIARRYALPVVLHCRKAMHLVFADLPMLKRLPSVIFHGWPGGLNEAVSLLERGVNAWFCAGKGLLRKDRSLIATAAGIPFDRLLAETDAPYMQLKGEKLTPARDIVKVYAAIAALRGIGTEQCESVIERNFRSAFGLQLQ